MKQTHHCTLQNAEKEFRRLPKFATFREKFKRRHQLSILMSFNHPLARLYYRTYSAIRVARIEHINSSYWYIIHPFSNFRKHWELFMTLLLTVLLILTPLNVAFGRITLIYSTILLNTVCIFDVGIKFFTGYTIDHLKTVVLNPRMITRKHWELFMLLLLTVFLILTPLNVAFGRISLMYSTILLNTVCIFDVGIKFFTGYTIDHLKRVVLNPRMITRHYLKSCDFYLEFFSTFPLLIFAWAGCLHNPHNIFPTFMTGLFVLKALRLKCLLDYAGHVFENYYIVDRWYLGHVKFLITFILTLHWFGCMVPISERYNLMFIKYEPTCENWDKSKYDVNYNYHENDFEVYYESVYIAARHLFCITKKNHQDLIGFRHVCQYILTSIVGYLFWCFALVLFIQTLFRIDNADIRYESVMNQLNKYMRHKQIPIKMQQRLIDYYEFSLGKSYCREATVITLLSKRLQHEIIMHATSMMAKNVTFLRELPDDIMSNIIANMKLEIFLPNDVIMMAGAQATGMYFINTGTVSVFSPSGREICHLEDGSYFGEVGLITQEKRNIANVIALEITEVYWLDKKDFYKQIRGNLPELYRKMESKAERRKENTQVMEEIHRKQMLEATMRIKLN